MHEAKTPEERSAIARKAANARWDAIKKQKSRAKSRKGGTKA